MPGGAYAYSFGRTYVQPRGLNWPEGSAARTPACLVALASWGEPVPQKRLVQGLELLEKNGHFLRIARKYRGRTSPGTRTRATSASTATTTPRPVGLVPAETAKEHATLIGGHLLPLQEQDGSWWDYQLFRFHKAYGTGYVLMTLGRALRVLGQ